METKTITVPEICFNVVGASTATKKVTITSALLKDPIKENPSDDTSRMTPAMTRFNPQARKQLSRMGGHHILKAEKIELSVKNHSMPAAGTRETRHAGATKDK
mmetsp:Transcript_159449/g.290870  ORF Transcript_159449/g.290870 Transcript_159449/m.290870 type:complete len:103 (+) Transcript_159449:709-1017(+)